MSNRSKRARALRAERERRQRKLAGPGGLGGSSPTSTPLAYCATCGLVLRAPSGIVGFALVRPDGSRGDVAQISITCGRCGQAWPAFNQLSYDSPGGQHIQFGVTEQDIADAQAAVDYFREFDSLKPEEIADEIARRAPWLQRIADEVRKSPVAVTMSVVGVLMAAIALAQSQGGVTDEQFDELVQLLDNRLPSEQPPIDSIPDIQDPQQPDAGNGPPTAVPGPQ